MTQEKSPRGREWPALYPRHEWPSQNIVPAGPPVPSAQAVSDIVVAVAAADIQIFSSAGTFTWTMPSNKVIAHIVCIGGGGGGGGGRRGAAGSVRLGGGGGAGGGLVVFDIPLISLAATETVHVGAAGPGGPGAPVNDSDGTAGGDGAASYFTVQGVSTVIYANGGSHGLGGNPSAGPSRGGVNGNRAAGYYGGGGGDGGDSDTAVQASKGVTTPGSGNAGVGAFPNVGSVNSVGLLTQLGAGGGGGGGAIDAADVGRSGGNGGNAYGLAGGAHGTPGADGSSSGTDLYLPGGGGGGGDTGAQSNGGAGGLYGGGGGGGNARLNGSPPGNGGNGADGVVIVISY